MREIKPGEERAQIGWDWEELDNGIPQGRHQRRKWDCNQRSRRQMQLLSLAGVVSEGREAAQEERQGKAV